MPGIQLFVDFQPQADGDPADQREAQHQRLALHRQVEHVFQVQQGARLVSRLKRQGSQEDVG